MFEGTVAGLRASGTLTGRHLDDRASLKPTVRKAAGVLEVRGCQHAQPEATSTSTSRSGVLVVVTGVAGSGKSSLIHGSVSGREGVVSIDQGAIKGSRRSNPATYTDLLEPIRKAFAKANGVKPALFSANSEGACPTCNGAGVIYTDLGMMAGVATHVRRLRRQALRRIGAEVPPRWPRHQRGARDVRERGRGRSSAPAMRTFPQHTRSLSVWPT